MLQQWIESAQRIASSGGMWIAGAAALVGVVFWLGGARFGRSTLTLLLVSLGAVAGKHLPDWAGWSIDPMGSGIAGALVMGLLGYALYRLWAALCLGGMLALWAGWCAWVFVGLGTLTVPAVTEQTTIHDFVSQLWAELTPGARLWLGASCTGAMALGCMIGIVWKRVGVSLLFSLVGVSMILSVLIYASMARWPMVLARIPSRPVIQLAVVASLVGIGLLAQYRLAPRPVGAQASTKDEDWDDDE